jgi:dihydrofolate reductase
MGLIKMIAAHTEKGHIGIGDKLLWHLERDLYRFKELTQGHNLVVGRRTYDTLPKLEGRDLVVLTRNPDFRTNDKNPARIFTDFGELLRYCRDSKGEIFIGGGAQIYEMFMPYANEMILTVIKSDEKTGDIYFPTITSEWEMRDIRDVLDRERLTKKQKGEGKVAKQIHTRLEYWTNKKPQQIN